MIRKLLFVLALCAFFGEASPAVAQNVTCATRPAGDSSNACASTSFVQSALSSLCTVLPGTCASIYGYANISWYGAVAADTTKSTINQTAFLAALAASPNVYCPAGQTFYTRSITIPTTVKKIYGACTLIAQGSYSGANAVLSATNPVSLTITDLTIANDLTSFPTIDGIDIISGTNVLLQNMTLNGYDAIFDLNSTRTAINNVKVTDFTNIGIFASGHTDIKVTNNSVISVTAASNYCISTSTGTGSVVTGNTVQDCKLFGLVLSGNPNTPFTAASQIVVSNNRVVNTVREGINITGGTDWTIVGNVVTWTNGSSTDFGISVYNPPSNSPGGDVLRGTIAGNVVNNSCKSGIALDNISKYVTVTGNTVYNANACNGATPYHLQAILAYGGASSNFISANNIIDPNNRLTYGIAEYDDGTGTLPNANTVGHNAGTGNAAKVHIIGTTSKVGFGCYFVGGASDCTGALPTSVIGHIPTYNVTNSQSLSDSGIALSGSGTIALSSAQLSFAAGSAFTTGGAFSVAATASAATSFIWPVVAGDVLVARADVATLTNKIFNCANNTCTVRIGTDVSGLGTGNATALAINVGTAGSFLTTSKHILAFGSQSGVGGPATTAFFFIGASSVEINVVAIAPVAGTFRNMYLNGNVAPGVGQTDTYTLRINGADSAITCQFSGGASTTCNDTTHSASITAGQTYTIKVVGSAGAAATIANGGIEFDTQ